MRMRKHIREEELEFQIAPMIDVLLVLLCFFIVITSASVLRSDKGLTLPVAVNGNKKPTAYSEAVLNVRWSPEENKGWVTMEDVKYENLDQIGPILSPRSKMNTKYRAVIRADKSTPAGYVQKVMNAIAEGGIIDISFSVLNRE
jgi:biopolymer transport protein ExbD